MSKPTIQCVAVKDVHAFACDAAGAARPGDLVPISRTRARAWTGNPHASPGDVALLVARLDGQCAGYLGLVPAQLKIGSRLEKIYWTSTFYVPPHQRASAVGALLVMRAIALGYNIAAAAPSEQATRVYKAIGFHECRPFAYLTCDLARLDVAALPFRAARRLLRPFKLRLDLVDEGVTLGRWATRRLVYPLLCAGERSAEGRQYAPCSDALSDRSFETGQQGPVCFYRDADFTRWMLSTPWVTTNPGERTHGCYFDDFREHFEYQVLEPPGGGFVILLLASRGREREVRVLDYHFKRPADLATLAALAFERARAFDAGCVSLPSACEGLVAGSPLLRSVCRRAERRTFVRFTSPDLSPSDVVDRLSLHYCDGDMPFA